MKRRWLWIPGLLIGLVLLAMFVDRRVRAPDAWLAEAKLAARKGDFETALRRARDVLARRPESLDALLLAAESAGKLEQIAEAVAWCREIPDSAESDRVVRILRETAQAAVLAGEVSEAEELYLRGLALAPDDLVMRRRLSAIYLTESRRWESQPHLFALLKGREFTLQELAFLGNSEELYEADAMIEYFRTSDPEDVTPLMGRARLLLFKSFPEEGEALLRRILEQRPELIEAQAQLGVVLVSESRADEFREWHQQLPAAADGHPEIWWVRATQARREGMTQPAVRCAWEALRRDPNHLGATYQLAQLLATDGQPETAQVFAARASKLELLATNLHDVLIRENTAERVIRCARLCEELGRIPEAWGWQMVLQAYHPEQAQDAERERLEDRLTPELPQTLPSQRLAEQHDFSHYPLPDWANQSTDALTSGSSEGASVAFAETGLGWGYRNGAPSDGPGFMIYQSIGGGVGVIDFDRDGWPDLYLPQASAASPLDDQPPESSDTLVRNDRGAAVEVTELSLPGDREYGFGVASGDFDSDGFTDLYVANGRQNRLLRNLGDGTFEDVTAAAGLTHRDWTASALIADLNGDGLPDLYDVNYCGGERPYSHVCLREDSDIPRTCIPTEFQAADDRLLVSRGDGRFDDVSAASGILVPEGRGLGIIAAQLDDQPGLDLYIANDMSANFLFLNRTEGPGANPAFLERGVISGTAYDSDGRPQASMGIAADDADGDGRLDLFLTHFYNESNTFYRQQPGRFFTDDTNLVGLRDPSMQTLGFGTQFLDADLDGWPDLVVANGHVDDFTDGEMPFRMRPQYFRNAQGTFAELPPDGLGDFFEREQLGRGLARLDWDGDLRDDFVVTRLLDDASLLINQTAVTGRSLAIRLTGRSDREAFGTEVRVTAGGRTRVQQLVAGDGFACSNERQLIFGLGEATVADRVEVRWPDGVVSELTGLAAGDTWQIVESPARAWRLPDNGR